MSRVASHKLVLLGESAVGKSSLVLRFVRDEYSDFRESTIGAAFLTQTLQLEDDRTVKLEIWDTAGQERYRSLAPIYFRNSAAALIVYDVSQPPEASFERAKTWVQTLQRQADPGIIICLVGNKVDLAATEGGRRTPKELAERFAKEEGLLFFEASAKTGEGVQELFEEVARKMPLASASQSASAKKGGVSLNAKGADKAGAASACQC